MVVESGMPGATPKPGAMPGPGAIPMPRVRAGCAFCGNTARHRRSRAALRLTMAPLLLTLAGCGSLPAERLPDENRAPVDTERFTLLTRFVHISDAQIMDEESPARLTWAAELVPSAWRSYEAYSTHLLDGFVSTINRMHAAGERINWVVHTGDATDNAQQNELDWFITVMEGGPIDPRSGPDDRDADQRPPPLLDPHEPFEASGLYRMGVHGDAPTIPWYAVVGNHDRFAQGTFPIVPDLLGRLVSPMPLPNRLGLLLPVRLVPTGSFTHSPITPGHPTPTFEAHLPRFVTPNDQRRFITDRGFVTAHLNSTSQPPGHGFSVDRPDRTWYSLEVAPGVRLIALNSARPLLETPANVYSEGSISLAQFLFLERELERAVDRGEWVIVVTHHPSGSLRPEYGTAVLPAGLRYTLGRFPCVKLHLAGHSHRNAVFDRGGYLEIETGSTLDYPQQGRVIEVWSDGLDVELRYRLFSHLDRIEPPEDLEDSPVFNDPYRELRIEAAQLAGVGAPSLAQ